MKERKSIDTMEENKNNAPHANQQAGEEKRGHRRNHRGGKKHHNRQKHTQNESAPLQAQAATGGAGEATEKKPSQQKQKQNHNPERKHKEHKGKKPGAQKRQPEHFVHKDDIYGNPQEEKELAEWRAKIVLNAASPSAPLATALPLSPTEPQNAPEEESVEIPEGTDLFESPVMRSPKKGGEQVEVVGVRFRSAGKTYYFAPNGHTLQKGDFAIVETARGPEFGEICLENSMVDASETVTPLRPLLRIATPADIAHNEENRKKEQEALSICQKKIEAHKLDMKLIEAQFAFDNSKLLFYFSSDGRVDFRELVKDLASVFRTRIELRQIGIRDEAKMLGGLGACGRPLCCSTFLPDFAQVSIKMAKEQGLSLNSAKISGMCGRLMCCLRFESEVYSEEIKLTPSVDTIVKTEDGVGTVISTNPLAGTVRVVLKDSPDTPPKQYHRSTVTVLGKRNKNQESQKAKESENQ